MPSGGGRERRREGRTLERGIAGGRRVEWQRKMKMAIEIGASLSYTKLRRDNRRELWS